MEALPKDKQTVSIPIHLIGSEYAIPSLSINPGVNPTFLLQKDNVIGYAVINGYLINLKTKESNFKNALIFRN